ncbi:hypothetical protein [Paludisphaera borealis]|uniref:hypothetical protein n=1 Tax=Paludisphaera borealis TaxID=1387353 RepID=UPI0011AB411A|nr:hypothetical protein [Paludisphaera borealis]
MYPRQVDVGEAIDLFTNDGSGHAGDDATGMLYAERALATAAFNRTLGNTPAHHFLADSDLRDYAKSLIELYNRFDIAAGPRHAEQLIRGIESQAADQARRRSGIGL